MIPIRCLQAGKNASPPSVTQPSKISDKLPSLKSTVGEEGELLFHCLNLQCVLNR